MGRNPSITEVITLTKNYLKKNGGDRLRMKRTDGTNSSNFV